jgi:hypothetical protein
MMMLLMIEVHVVLVRSGVPVATLAGDLAHFCLSLFFAHGSNECATISWLCSLQDER